MNNIFSYTNYRQYIQDFYNSQKKAKKHFSYEFFARRAGFDSRGNFFKIVKGRIALPKKKIFDVASAMGLNKKQTEYFEALVNFNEAKTVKEREYYFDKFRSLVKKGPAANILESQYAFYSKWYNLVIRELVTFLDFKDDFQVLAKTVDPAITKSQAKASVRLLLKLGLIEKLPNGKYRQTEKHLTTGDEVRSLAVQKYHQENLKLAGESIDRHKRSVRDISSVTAGISKKGFETLKKDIQQFRKHLQEVVDKDDQTDAVYQINFQMFPMSKLTDHWRNQ